MQNLFMRHVLPCYDGAKALSVNKIHPVKKLIWQTTYHIVFRYDVSLDYLERVDNIEIYCTAHSSEPRKNVYQTLNFLQRNNFANNEFLAIPKPLFYNQKFNASFYQGVEGVNLYTHIKENHRADIESILFEAARWLSRLHQMPVRANKLFNQPNSRLETVFPGSKHVIDDVRRCYPEYLGLYEKFYDFFIKSEEACLSGIKKLSLIHGDAHPENVVKLHDGRLALIDYTDMSYGDYARDLGTFLQQLEYMAGRKLNNKQYVDKLKKIFLESYLGLSNIKMTPELEERIKVYYNWTAIRTATFFLLKHDPQPERAEPLIRMVESNLN